MQELRVCATSSGSLIGMLVRKQGLSLKQAGKNCVLC